MESAPDAARLGEIAGQVAAGELSTRVAATLPVERAAEAHERLAAGGVRGRIVLTF